MNFPLQVPPQPLALSPPQQNSSRGWLHLLARNRYQLAGVLLVAILLPALISSEFDVTGHLPGTAENTAFATFIAVLLGAYLFRRLAAFPGVPRYSFMFAAFVATYGGMIAVFSFVGIEYSQLQFAASFLAAIAWFMFVLHVEWPMRRPCLLVVPGGDAERLTEIAKADWHVAFSPSETPNPITGVVADLRADFDPAWVRFFADCAKQGLPVYHCKQVREALTGCVAIDHLSEITLSSLLPSSAYMRNKRLFDVLGVLIAAPLVVPLALSTAVLIKLVDGGPVLFRQTRVGFRGRLFSIYKFRTMRSEVKLGKHFTEEDDPRISRVGRVLRRYRIDELPQIINVLKGEMSWIGPRPESVALSEYYDSHIPYYSYRLIVRPGITGWAQVNQGNVAMIEAATEKLYYDFYYIKHFSPWLELLIAAMTVPVVLTGRGSR